MSPGETCAEGKGIVSSMGSFKYFLGKAWTILIHCDPFHHTLTVIVQPTLKANVYLPQRALWCEFLIVQLIVGNTEAGWTWH